MQTHLAIIYYKLGQHAYSSWPGIGSHSRPNNLFSGLI